MRAAVFHGGSRPVSIVDVGLREPGPGEVRVAIRAAGLCHSDLSVIDGTIPYPTPVVLGHEGAGVVEAVGPGVQSVKEGDAVVLSTLAHCGRCAACEVGRPTECRNAPNPKDTQPFVLDDAKPEERERGMAAGMRFLAVCDLVAVYVDRGVSKGMKREIQEAIRIATPVEWRKLSRRPVSKAEVDEIMSSLGAL